MGDDGGAAQIKNAQVLEEGGGRRDIYRGPPFVPGEATTRYKSAFCPGSWLHPGQKTPHIFPSSLLHPSPKHLFLLVPPPSVPLLPPPRELNVPEHRRRRRHRPAPLRAPPPLMSAIPAPAPCHLGFAAPASTPRARPRLRRPWRPPLHATALPPSPLRATAPPAPRLVVQGRAAPLGFPAALCE